MVLDLEVLRRALIESCCYSALHFNSKFSIEPYHWLYLDLIQFSSLQQQKHSSQTVTVDYTVPYSLAF